MSLRIGGIIYFVAAIIQIFSPNLASLIVGRSLQGLAVGILSMTVPILQCEIAPGHSRGMFISIEYICLNGGYTLSALHLAEPMSSLIMHAHDSRCNLWCSINALQATTNMHTQVNSLCPWYNSPSARRALLP